MKEKDFKKASRGEESEYLTAPMPLYDDEEGKKLAVIKKTGANKAAVGQFQKLFHTRDEHSILHPENRRAEQEIFIGSSEIEERDSVRYAIQTAFTPTLLKNGEATLSSDVLQKFVHTFSEKGLPKSDKELISKQLESEARKNDGFITFNTDNFNENSSLANSMLASMLTIHSKSVSEEYGPLRTLTKQGHSVAVEEMASAEPLQQWASNSKGSSLNR